MNDVVTQKSNAPMILGIVGFVAMIPGLICASACGSMASVSNPSAGTFITMMSVVPTIAAFIFGFLSKTKPKQAGIVMVSSAIILSISVIMTGNWIFGLIAVGSFLIGGVLSFQNQ